LLNPFNNGSFKCHWTQIQVSGSLSINTGIAPKYKIGLAEAEKSYFDKVLRPPASAPKELIQDE
jgi:hypothetical protein